MSSSAPAAPIQFERQATGLVREAGWVDVLVYNINFISIGLMAVFMFTVTIPSYAGVNPYLNELIAFLIVIPVSFVFAMFGAALPRSGGDYVYVSRTLHPSLGMMSSFNNTVWWFIYGGVPSAFFARYGLGPFFRTVGRMSGNQTLTSWGDALLTNLGTLVAGTILIVALAIIFSYSLRLYFRFQNALFYFAMLSIVISILVFVVQSHASVVSALNATFGQGSVEKALSTTKFAESPFDLGNTILPMTWLYLELVFNQSSAYIGGEVRRASRVQLWSMPAAAVIATVVLLILTLSVLSSVGVNLLGAIGADNGASFGLTSAPIFTEIAAVASGQVWLAVIMLAGFVFWSYTWLPGQMLNASRNMVAYSLDGIMPRQLSYVHKRYHTPLVSVWLVAIGSIVFLYLYIYTAVFATLTGIFGFILSFGLVSIAAILFPYRLKDVFESSPVRWRFGGVPVITIVGVLALISCIVSEIIFLKDPLAGFQQADGSPYWSRIIYNVAIFCSGFVIYFVARWLNRRRGVDIDRRFASIPVE